MKWLKHKRDIKELKEYDNALIIWKPIWNEIHIPRKIIKCQIWQKKLSTE